LIDVVEPFFRVIVELGYDRSIPPWEPTPARLIPTLDPGKVATDLVNAIGEGFNNALALIDLPPLPSMPAPATTDTGQVTSSKQGTDTDRPPSQPTKRADTATAGSSSAASSSAGSPSRGNSRGNSSGGDADGSQLS
jgi:hypothetical protein